MTIEQIPTLEDQLAALEGDQPPDECEVCGTILLDELDGPGHLCYECAADAQEAKPDASEDHQPH